MKLVQPKAWEIADPARKAALLAEMRAMKKSPEARERPPLFESFEALLEKQPPQN